MPPARAVVLATYQPHERKSVVTTEAAPVKVGAPTTARAVASFNIACARATNGFAIRTQRIPAPARVVLRRLAGG
eukprot:6179153-Pleurochrysis_carterae.AAC.1